MRAKWNLELALQKKREEDKKKQEQQDKDKDNKDKKKQDDQKKQDQDKKQDEKKQEPDAGAPKQEPPKPPQARTLEPSRRRKKNPAPSQDDKAPEMSEIDAVLDSLERSPKDLEKMRARLRAVRRAPPAKDW